MSSVPYQSQSARKLSSSLNFFTIVFCGIAQYLFINFFYASIDLSMARDLQSYQDIIDAVKDDPLSFSIFSLESILHRTLQLGEYFSSIIFQITGKFGVSAIKLHVATIIALTITCIYLQLNRITNASLVLIINLACPIIFSNLLLGNTRQLWGCILILLFYGRTPLFLYFKKINRSWFEMIFRIALFLLILLGVHIGSALIFIIVLTIDYLSSIYIKHGFLNLHLYLWGGINFFIFSVVILIVFAIANHFGEGYLQPKVDFYLYGIDLHSYPYLTSGIFYLMLIPLSVDAFIFLKKNLSIKYLQFLMMCIWFLISASFLLPFSYALHRIITSLLFFAFVMRLRNGGLKNEYIYTFIRLIATCYYVVVR
jgi:hypothetical protein